MKSLRESLFDVEKNITKDMTFGDLFELDEKSSSNWKYCPLDKQFSVQRIKSKAKVTGTDKRGIIFKGMVKLIENIKLEGSLEDINKAWLFYQVENVVWDFFQFSMMKKSVFITISIFNGGHLVLDKDISLFNGCDIIQVGLGPELNLVFRRK